MRTMDSTIPPKAFTRLLRACSALGSAVICLQEEINVIRGKGEPAAADKLEEEVKEFLTEYVRFLNDAVTELEAHARDH